jgi:hypothetical protein
MAMIHASPAPVAATAAVAAVVVASESISLSPDTSSSPSWRRLLPKKEAVKRWLKPSLQILDNIGTVVHLPPKNSTSLPWQLRVMTYEWPSDWDHVCHLLAVRFMKHSYTATSTSSTTQPSTTRSSQDITAPLPALPVLPFELQLIIASYCVLGHEIGRVYERRQQWSAAFIAYQHSMQFDHHPFGAFKVGFCYCW